MLDGGSTWVATLLLEQRLMIVFQPILDHIGMHDYPVVQGLFALSKTRNNPCFVKSIHFRMLQVIFHEEFFHPDPSGSMMLHVICEGIQEFL